jgi:hypothetical protein
MVKLVVNLLRNLLNHFGYFNLDGSSRYRFVKEIYLETRTMIEIQPLVDEVLRSQSNLSVNLHEPPVNSAVKIKPKHFQYWHQGVNAVPDVIYNCYLSIDHFLMDDFEIIRLDYETLKNYIKLPEHIIKARDEGRMTIAHFSDIIRNKLLLDYGGMWLDSSVMITSKDKLRYFYEERNVAFQNTPVFSNPKEHAVLIGSWMIWSRHSNSQVFRLTQEVLELYWERNKNISNYFLYHIVISDLIRKSAEIQREIDWHRRYYSSNSLDILFFMLNRSFERREIMRLFDSVGIHKLDFKAKRPMGDDLLNYHVFYDKEMFNDLLWSKYING